MPPITAFLHTHNDALRLGRTLEMLLPCSEIVVVDHASTDRTCTVAREYGTRVIAAHSGGENLYIEQVHNPWVFCVRPGESITENLQASLFEWMLVPRGETSANGFSVFIREQSGELNDPQWHRSPLPQTRLVPRTWSRWQQGLPVHDPSSVVIEGELLRFVVP
jgi:glycosyltransferase involved in cell wall biosynthesis